MEKIVQQGLLYDFYGELLTSHQQHIYEDVVMNDMSLSKDETTRTTVRKEKTLDNKLSFVYDYTGD